jgi:hypothetical protein
VPLDREGDMALRRGDLDGAVGYYRRMHAILSGVADVLGNPQAQQEAAYAEAKLANALRMQQRPTNNDLSSLKLTKAEGTYMNNGEEAKNLVSSYLESNGIKFYDASNERVQRIRLGWTTKTIESIDVNMFFDEDGGSVHLVTMLPLEIPVGNLAQALFEVNRCNKSYRWISFYLDDDRTIMCEIDAVIEPGTAGQEVLELIQRTLETCDDVYPAFVALAKE